jgi:acetyl esterase/lipase
MNSANTKRVDPELLAFLETVPTIAFSDALLGRIRAVPLSWPGGDTRCNPVQTAAITITGTRGEPDVTVRLSRPQQCPGPLPCILHLHGGGFVSGSAAASDAKCRQLAFELNCLVVSVDYRLAPETRFPGAIEDCFAALTWLHAEAEGLQVDPARVGVMGESAGGGLAAALALLTRDRGGPALAFQHLIYPMLDDRTCTRVDRNPLAGRFIWTLHNNQYGWSSLLGEAPGGAGVSPYAAPARAPDLSGLPPAFISTGDLDLFLEEDVAYAQRLSRSGVPVELHVYPGCFHGFDLAPAAEIAARSRTDSLKALAGALNSGPP